MILFVISLKVTFFAFHCHIGADFNQWQTSFPMIFIGLAMSGWREWRFFKMSY